MEYKNVHWFRRGRFCTSCKVDFLTAEVEEDLLVALINLSEALAEVQSDAKSYLKKSELASELLMKLTTSIDNLWPTQSDENS